MRHLFGFVCVCALGLMPLVGCETGGTAGGGGTAGDGGGGGTGGSNSAVFPCTEQGILDAIAEGGGPHTFDCGGPQTVTTLAEIEIDNNVILDGEGNLTIDGNGDHRVFSVAEGIEAELHRFSVTRGWSSSASKRGGGILNMGTLSVTNSTISGNNGTGINNWFEATLTLANSTVSDNTGEVGGIQNNGPLTMTNSTVSGNTAGGGAGGIWNNGPLTMTNSTLSGNTARPGTGGLFVALHSEATVTNSTVSGNIGGWGGGVDNFGSLTLVHTTVSDNFTDFNVVVRGIANLSESPVTLVNSVVDGDCFGNINSNGYNIESPADTCGFDQSTDMPGVSADDLKLGELADNDGPTMTHALGEGSVAIDHIPAVDCGVTTDQRGEPRPETGGDACDVGSFERQPEDP